ncbi:MAG: carbon-nitrogen hydrolase family protein [Dethiobacteria bacterium]|jgi:predicted amidohydrolase
MKYKVAAIQMDTVPEKKEVNLKKALELYDEAVSQGAKVVCYPEYFLTCPPHQNMKDRVKDLAETIPGPSVDKFREKAKETQTYCVAGSIIELSKDGKLYNTSTLIGPDGEVIGKYSKVHPENAPAKHEPGCGITPGDGDYPVFETELGRFAIMIDMDVSCPEVSRIYGLKGADIIFAPIAWSAKFIPAIEVFSRASSMYSLAYVVFANPVGWRKNVPLHSWAFVGQSEVDLVYGGGSGVALGVNIIGRVPNFSEGVVVTTVDTDKVKQSRENDASIYPYWRRPETYKTLTDPKTNRPFGTA